MVLKALDVAKYILSLTDEESGNTISDLALQKLLYYAQGYYIACFNKPLFKENIEAWEHGPVIREVYKEYKKYDYKPIPKYKFTKDEKKQFSEEEKSIIEFIFDKLSGYPAKQLEYKTHRERPWLETYSRNEKNKVITYDKLKNSFEKKKDIKDCRLYLMADKICKEGEKRIKISYEDFIKSPDNYKGNYCIVCKTAEQGKKYYDEYLDYSNSLFFENGDEGVKFSKIC